MATTKVCTKCNEEKEFGEFYPSRGSYTSDCRQCRSEYSKTRYTEKKEHILSLNKIWRENNPGRQKELVDAWYDRNKESLSEHRKNRRVEHRDEVLEREAVYRENNHDSILEYHRTWKSDNEEHCREYNRQYITRRLAEDPLFKLLHNLRARVNMAIKAVSGEKAEKTMELLGCSVQHVRDHLESQFTEGMTWENQGEWHVDHIRPCASFNLEDPEEQKKCFHWTNLQPLWALDNIRKGAKYVC
jgi:hypothetical protein